MRETRPIWRIKVDAAQRFVLWHYLCSFIPYVLVAEFPKSGGTWLSQMLSDILDLPFPRNRSAPLIPCVLHGHYPYHKRFRKPIVLLRDGRDMVVSAYYHFLISHDLNPSFLVRHWQDKFNFSNVEDIKTNLPAFMEVFLLNFRIGGQKVSWTDFISSYLDRPNVLFVRYEDLLDDAARELGRILAHLGYTSIDLQKVRSVIERYDFKRQTSRLPGTEDTSRFLRKGISGDWKNKFTSEAAAKFDKIAGNTLIRLGYEKDHDWF